MANIKLSESDIDKIVSKLHQKIVNEAVHGAIVNEVEQRAKEIAFNFTATTIEYFYQDYIKNQIDEKYSDIRDHITEKFKEEYSKDLVSHIKSVNNLLNIYADKVAEEIQDIM